MLYPNSRFLSAIFVVRLCNVLETLPIVRNLSLIMALSIALVWGYASCFIGCINSPKTRRVSLPDLCGRSHNL